MSNCTDSLPIICIDFKKSRFRIHKNTLRMLGNPDYIQLLVNPHENILAIKCSIREDRLAHFVQLERFPAKNSYELYSNSLASTLLQNNQHLHHGSSYRFYGSLNTTHGIALFCLNNAVPISPNKCEEVAI